MDITNADQARVWAETEFRNIKGVLSALQRLSREREALKKSFAVRDTLAESHQLNARQALVSRIETAIQSHRLGEPWNPA